MRRQVRRRLRGRPVTSRRARHRRCSVPCRRARPGAAAAAVRAVQAVVERPGSGGRRTWLCAQPSVVPSPAPASTTRSRGSGPGARSAPAETTATGIRKTEQLTERGRHHPSPPDWALGHTHATSRRRSRTCGSGAGTRYRWPSPSVAVQFPQTQGPRPPPERSGAPAVDATPRPRWTRGCRARLLDPSTAEHQLALHAYRRRYPRVPVEDASPVLVLTPDRTPDRGVSVRRGRRPNDLGELR